jgi:ketosteroid isomerase-like protein
MILNDCPGSTTPFKRFVQFAVLFYGAAVMPVGQAAADATAPVTELVQRFTEAQGNMDAPTLKTLTAENYIEVSPLGEVDPREKMLTFYVKDDKRVRPALTLEEITPRLLGDTAVVIAKISYSSMVEGEKRTFSLRSTFVAEKLNGTWKMVSVQHTPIRPHKTPG